MLPFRIFEQNVYPEKWHIPWCPNIASTPPLGDPHWSWKMTFSDFWNSPLLPKMTYHLTVLPGGKVLVLISTLLLFLGSSNFPQIYIIKLYFKLAEKIWNNGHHNSNIQRTIEIKICYYCRILKLNFGQNTQVRWNSVKEIVLWKNCSYTKASDYKRAFFVFNYIVLLPVSSPWQQRKFHQPINI